VIFGAAAIALAASAVVMKSRRLIGMERILDWRLPIGNCRLVAIHGITAKAPALATDLHG
jgi:hypothetical protein